MTWNMNNEEVSRNKCLKTQTEKVGGKVLREGYWGQKSTRSQ